MTHSLKVAMMRSPAFYWKKACEFGRPGFTVGELAGCTCGIAYNTVRQWVFDMARRGELKVVGAEPGICGKMKNRYAVVRPSVKPPAPRRPEVTSGRNCGRLQEQLWNTMRMLKESWTLQELTLAASTEEFPVSRRTANFYVLTLARVGIVQTITAHEVGKKGRCGAVAGRYRLTRKITGPKPPQILQAQFVYDQNSDKIIGESEVRNGLA